MRDGGGCATCPVEHCETLTYRGSACMAQREKLGLGDPWTHADRIRAMSDEELARLFAKAPLCRAGETRVDCRSTKSCLECLTV